MSDVYNSLTRYKAWVDSITEADNMEAQIAVLKAERDRYRTALETIAEAADELLDFDVEANNFEREAECWEKVARMRRTIAQGALAKAPLAATKEEK